MVAELNEDITIAFDLGTTHCFVGYTWDGSVYSLSKAGFPVVLNFANGELQIGYKSKDEQPKNVETTIYNVKRLMGCDYYQLSVWKDLKRLLYKVTGSSTEWCDPLIEMNSYNGIKSFTPEQIIGMFLRELKLMVERHLHRKVRKAVISIPSGYNVFQRQATVDAAHIAGLSDVMLIHSSVAVAIHYCVKEVDLSPIDLLVFDVGGGTTEVSIIRITNGPNGKEIEQMAIAGDTHLGGEDFTDSLMDYCIEKVKIRLNYDVYQSRMSLFELRSKCEEAKIKLSIDWETEIDFELNGEKLKIPVDRMLFESLNFDYFKKCARLMENVLCSMAGYRKERIQKVILTGGSCQIPKITKLLTEFFEEHKIYKTPVSSRNISIGAAHQHLWKHRSCYPYTLALSESREFAMTIAPANTILPSHGNSKKLLYDSNLVMNGRFDLSEVEYGRERFYGQLWLEEGSYKSRNVSISLNFDSNGIHTIEAIDKLTHERGSWTVTNRKRHLPM